MGDEDRGAGETERGDRLDPAEEELRELWRWLVDLQRHAEAGLRAQDLVHEIRNDLTKILPAIQLAQLEAEPEAWQRALQEVYGHAQKMRERLQQFDALGRPGGAPQAHSLVEMADRALDALAYPLKKCEARVERSRQGRDRVLADRALVLRAIATAALAVLQRVPSPRPEAPRPRLFVHVEEEGGRVHLDLWSDAAVDAASTSARAESWRQRSTGLEHRVIERVLASLEGRYHWDDAKARARLTFPLAEDAAPASDDPYRI